MSAVSPTMKMVHEGQITPIQMLEKSVIEHPRFAAAKKRALLLPRRCEQGLDARILTITGNPGAGKTTLLRHLPTGLIENREDRQIRHAVYFQVPKLATWRSLASAMMAGLDPNLRVPKHFNSTDLVNALKPMIALKEVTLWLADEGHRLVTRRNREVQKDTADFIVQLLNELNVCIVLAGLSELMMLVQVETVEDGVLGRRRDAHYFLAPYNWMDLHGRAHFFGFLKHLERRILLPRPTIISSEDIAVRLYVASCGEPGLVVKLLSEALTRALDHQLACIDMAILADVFSDFVYGDDEQEDLPAKMNFAVSHEQLALGIGPNATDRYLDRSLAKQQNPFACDVQELDAIWEAYRKIGMSPMSGKSVRARI